MQDWLKKQKSISLAGCVYRGSISCRHCARSKEKQDEHTQIFSQTVLGSGARGRD